MPEINWTDAWVAVLTAGLALSVYLQHLTNKGIQDRITGLVVGKRDRPKPRFRARRVDTVFHDRDDEDREHWPCVKCGASVPQMGHTVAACEEWQAADALKAGREVATSGLENPGTPRNV